MKLEKKFFSITVYIHKIYMCSLVQSKNTSTIINQLV